MKKRVVIFLLIALTCLLLPLRILANEPPPNSLLPLWPDPVMTPLLNGQYPADIDTETAKEVMAAIYAFMQDSQEEWAENKPLTYNDLFKLAEEIKAVYPSSIHIPAQGGHGIGFTNGIPYLAVSVPFVQLYVGAFGLVVNTGISLPIIPLELGVIGMPYILAWRVIYANGLKSWVEGFWMPHLTIPFVGSVLAHIPPGDSLITISLGRITLNLYRTGGAEAFNIYISLGTLGLSSDSPLNNFSSDEIAFWFPKTLEIMEKLTSDHLTAGISEQDQQTIQNEAAAFEKTFAIAQ